MKKLIVLTLLGAGTVPMVIAKDKPTPATAEERADLNAAEVAKLNREITFQQSQILELQQQLVALDEINKAQAEVNRTLEDIRRAHGAAPGCVPDDSGSWKCPEPAKSKPAQK